MKAFSEDLKVLKSVHLRPVAAAFEANMERLKILAVTFAEIAYQARRDSSCLFYAEYKTTGKIAPPFSQEAKSLPPEVFKEFIRQLEPFVSKLTPDQRSYLVAELGVSLVNAMLKDTPEMAKSMEALLSSIVIGSWAVFETLAPDLWKAAVNHGPAALAQRVNLAMQGNPDPKIAKHWKDKLQHDPRKDYAASLIEGGRVTFRTLERIVYWYCVTFEGDARQIFKDNTDIYAVSAYRNAFIHNSGRADKDFIKQTEAVDDLRGKFIENQPLEIDGEFVSRLRTSVLTVGLKLLQLADDLITSPQEDVT